MGMKGRWGVTRTLTVGFAAIIIMGALLLTLPISSRDGRSIPFINALFTAGSATCVTGLVVYDTYSQFTLFGQIVILLLIQTGGLGFMTMLMMFAMFAGRRIGLRERILLAESMSSMQIGGVVRLVRRTLIGAFIFEGAGAALLALRFIPQFGPARGIWFSVFHSVSAFCNAGFDLMGINAPFSSLTAYVGDPLVNLTVIALIVTGGIGFIVWGDVMDHGFHIKKYALHSKVVLSATAILIVVGAALFMVLEDDGVFAGMSAWERVLAALFQSVTPRTAGFNTVDIASLGEGSKLLTVFLMIIGASPGSTGGGVKTSTFAVILLALIASVRAHDEVNVYRHRFEDGLVQKAYRNAALYVMMLLTGVFVLCAADGIDIGDALFEAASALGTVGLTGGATMQTGTAGKLALILLMYAGRLGSLTVFLAVAKNNGDTRMKNAVGRVIVG